MTVQVKIPYVRGLVNALAWHHSLKQMKVTYHQGLDVPSVLMVLPSLMMDAVPILVQAQTHTVRTESACAKLDTGS